MTLYTISNSKLWLFLFPNSNLFWCFFTHLIVSFESMWYFSFQYVCKYWFSLLQIPYFPNKILYLFSFSGLYLYSMVKAFITGFYICHTTNILNCKFRTIHWTKPPSFSYFQKICFFQAFLLKNPNSHLRFSFHPSFYFLSRQI